MNKLIEKIRAKLASTKSELEEASQLGKGAFHAGLKRVPAQDKKLMDLVEKSKLGFTSNLMSAWLKAWDKENLSNDVPKDHFNRSKLSYKERIVKSVASKISSNSDFTKEELAELDIAAELGRDAYNKGIKRIPAQDKKLDKLISENKQVTLLLPNFWFDGWDEKKEKKVKKESYSKSDFSKPEQKELERAFDLGKDAFDSGIERIPNKDKKLIELINRNKEVVILLTNSWLKAWDREQKKDEAKTKKSSEPCYRNTCPKCGNVNQCRCKNEKTETNNVCNSCKEKLKKAVLLKFSKMSIDNAWDIIYKFVEKTEVVKASFKLDMTIDKDQQKLLRSIFDNAPVEQLYTYSTNKFGFKLEDLRVDVEHGNLKIQKME